MSGKKVLIVSSNGLFREGLKHILAGTIDLAQTDQVSSLQEAEELVRMDQANVVICVRCDKGKGQECCVNNIKPLLSRPGVRVIVVSLKTGDLSIYSREQIKEASDEDLVSAITG
jgi:DNA-binding NarL/FixJ family response regulator